MKTNKKKSRAIAGAAFVNWIRFASQQDLFYRYSIDFQCNEHYRNGLNLEGGLK